MKLEECIEYFEIEAETSDSLMVPYEPRKKYSDDCKQMVEWLRELQAYREARNEITRKMNSGQWSEGVVYGLDKAVRIMEKHLREVTADGYSC